MEIPSLRGAIGLGLSGKRRNSKAPRLGMRARGPVFKAKSRLNVTGMSFARAGERKRLTEASDGISFRTMELGDNGV